MNEIWVNIKRVEGGYIVEYDMHTVVYISLQKAMANVKAILSGEKVETETP